MIGEGLPARLAGVFFGRACVTFPGIAKVCRDWAWACGTRRPELPERAELRSFLQTYSTRRSSDLDGSKTETWETDFPLHWYALIDWMDLDFGVGRMG